MKRGGAVARIGRSGSIIVVDIDESQTPCTQERSSLTLF